MRATRSEALLAGVPRLHSSHPRLCRRKASGFAQLHASGLSTSLSRANSSKASNGATSGFRVYRYVVDVHGQLFLHDTVPKNLTSCFKNVEFLDFFFKRVRPNPASVTAKPEYSRAGSLSRHDILSPPVGSTLSQDWSDAPPFNGNLSAEGTRSSEELFDEACRLGNAEGYEWISPCGPELNLVRCQDTPIVYRELSEQDGMLKWAGSLLEPFRPDQLLVDPANGYVYHPCPQPTRRKQRSARDATQPRYGPVSLLGSNLVLSRLAEGLDIDAEAFEQGEAGSIAWKGQRYKLGLLGRT